MVSQARSITHADSCCTESEDSDGALWQPDDGRSHDEWIATHGQSAEEMLRVKQKLVMLKMEQMVDVPAFDITVSIWELKG